MSFRGLTFEKSLKAFSTPPAAPVQEPDHGDELTIAYMSGVQRGKELAAQRQCEGCDKIAKP